jgi:hypothetical protein
VIERPSSVTPAALILEPLLEPVLAPLTDAMGEFGEFVAELCAESIAPRL